MNYCKNCGIQLDQHLRYCSNCGADLSTSLFPTEQGDESLKDNKLMALLSYIIFIIPLLAGEHKKSDFVKYHVNQGAALFIFYISWTILRSLTIFSLFSVPYFGFLLDLAFGMIGISLVILSIIGITNVLGDKIKPLPVIGKMTIIK